MYKSYFQVESIFNIVKLKSSFTPKKIDMWEQRIMTTKVNDI